MKQITFILFLLFANFSFSQTNREELGRKEMFKMYKLFPIETEKIRITVKEGINKLIAESSDSLFKNQMNLYVNKIDTISLPDYKKLDFEMISKDKLKNFRTDYDKFKKTGYITHKKSDNTRFSLYLAIDKELSHIRFNFKYDDREWLFIDQVIFIIDGKNYNLDFAEQQRNAYLGGVRETSDQPVRSYSQKIIDALSKTENPISIRFQGSQGVKDFEYSLKNLIPIKETIMLYNEF